MADSGLISVADALRQVLAGAAPVEPETVALALGVGRTLSEPLAARRTQPPVAVSAMDGYAVRADDIAALPVRLKVLGESAAGRGFRGRIETNEAVRIFTGAPLPAGADTVVVQETTRADGDHVVIQAGAARRTNIRAAGLDFRDGDALLATGTRLGPNHLALAAAMDHASLPVVRRPRVALLASGDELVMPGQERGPDQIVASNTFAVAALVEAAGGEVIDLGIAGDTMGALGAGIDAARDSSADVFVTLGGASVGDHDLVKDALAKAGMTLGFWRIAMRPGKPLIHGQLVSDGRCMRILGLPGNPVSAIVCAVLFLQPLVRALCGDPAAGSDASRSAVLGADVRANDMRQDYLRARIAIAADGSLVATPFGQQDSSMLRTLAQAQGLIVRPPHAEAARAGDACRYLALS